jgi:hypothetical protein
MLIVGHQSIVAVLRDQRRAADRYAGHPPAGGLVKAVVVVGIGDEDLVSFNRRQIAAVSAHDSFSTAHAPLRRTTVTAASGLSRDPETQRFDVAVDEASSNRRSRYALVLAANSSPA